MLLQRASDLQLAPQWMESEAYQIHIRMKGCQLFSHETVGGITTQCLNGKRKTKQKYDNLLFKNSTLGHIANIRGDESPTPGNVLPKTEIEETTRSRKGKHEVRRRRRENNKTPDAAPS